MRWCPNLFLRMANSGEARVVIISLVPSCWVVVARCSIASLGRSSSCFKGDAPKHYGCARDIHCWPFWRQYLRSSRRPVKWSVGIVGCSNLATGLAIFNDGWGPVSAVRSVGFGVGFSTIRASGCSDNRRGRSGWRRWRQRRRVLKVCRLWRWRSSCGLFPRRGRYLALGAPVLPNQAGHYWCRTRCVAQLRQGTCGIIVTAACNAIFVRVWFACPRVPLLSPTCL